MGKLNELFFDWRWWFIRKIYVYNKEFLKNKTKSHGDEVTNFYNTEISKVDSNYTGFAVTSLDPALTKDESYYPEVFLKECRYIKKIIIRHINGILSNIFYSYDKSDEE